MTPSRAGPVFRLSTPTSHAAPAALASITVTARAVVYTDVRCTARRNRGTVTLPCGGWLFALPGLAAFSLRIVPNQDARQGTGIAAKCPKCNTLYEVVTSVCP